MMKREERQKKGNVTRNFQWFGVVASSLALGGTAAFIASIESVNPSLVFMYDWTVAVIFLLVSLISFQGSRPFFFAAQTRRYTAVIQDRRWLYGLACVGGGATIGGMAYSLRGVSAERLADVGVGVLLAIVFLSIACYLLFRTIAFLEADEESVESFETQ